LIIYTKALKGTALRPENLSIHNTKFFLDFYETGFISVFYQQPCMEFKARHLM